MADNLDLLILPNQGDFSIVLSGARSSLAARGRKDASSLEVRESEPRYLARVGCIRRHRSLERGKLVPQVVHYGLIGTTGESIVEPVHNQIQSFSCGLAAFSVRPLLRRSHADVREEMFNPYHGLWGYLDWTGTVIIAPRFGHVRDFSENLAGVEVGGKWGYIFSDGTFAIEPLFDGVRDFKDGIAVARLGRKCGFIDRAGTFVVQPKFDYLWDFSDGLACADVDGKCGYIDPSGSFAIAPRFDSSKPSYLRSRDFRHGVAIVVDSDGIDCVINKAGDIVFQCTEGGEFIGEFTDGIARVSEAGGNGDHAYFIDSSGQPILKDIEADEDGGFADVFDAAEDFRDGLGLVAGSYACTNDNELWPLRRYADRKGSIRLYGYIDTQGNTRISPHFHSARPFKDGMAGVDPNGDKEFGFIDENGIMVIEPRFNQVGDFSCGLARVKEVTPEGKWGFSDSAGNLVIPFQFDQAEDFQKVTPSSLIKD